MKISNSQHLPLNDGGVSRVNRAATPVSRPADGAPAQAASISVSAPARASAAALDMYEAEEAVRPEVVAKAQQQLANWQPLTDGQITHIARDMLRR